MRRIYKLFIVAFIVLCTTNATAKDTNDKLFQGYEGGMMLHAGYLDGDITPLSHHATGVTKGIGGAIRLKLGNHWRIGTEGYTSTMKQLGNGSYIKTFWAGILTNYTWTWKRFAPYLGITFGGGNTTDFLMIKGSGNDWQPEDMVYYHKAPFVAIDPFIGCDYIVSDKLHLTFKIDHLKGVSNKELYLPTGPRAYIGFMFCH